MEQPARPQVTPSLRELDDVELLRMAVLTPQVGFEGPDDDVTLHVPDPVAEAATAHGELEVVDAEGVPLAVVSVASTYPVVAGTSGIVGAVRGLPGPVRRAFDAHYLPPSASVTALPPDTLTVPVTAPLTVDDVDTVRRLAAGRPVLLLVLAGAGTPRAVSSAGLVRATRAAADDVPQAVVVAVPAAARADRDRDAAFHRRVVAAYAPGLDVHVPEGRGPLPARVADVVRSEHPVGPDQGVVVYFTGLSGSGKSTLAQALRNRLLEHGERRTTLLDGDRVRRLLSSGLTFSRADRELNLERIAWVAAETSRHGGLTVCSAIAPFDASRRAAREVVTSAGSAFVLVHVATPLAECERRDRKGLYAKARRGEIASFTGISSPFEEPTDADLVVDTTDVSVDEALDVVLGHLVGHGWVDAGVLDRVVRPLETLA